MITLNESYHPYDGVYCFKLRRPEQTTRGKYPGEAQWAPTMFTRVVVRNIRNFFVIHGVYIGKEFGCSGCNLIPNRVDVEVFVNCFIREIPVYFSNIP